MRVFLACKSDDEMYIVVARDKRRAQSLLAVPGWVPMMEDIKEIDLSYEHIAEVIL